MKVHHPCVVRKREIESGTVGENLQRVYEKNNPVPINPEEDSATWALWLGYAIVFGLVYGSIQNVYEFQDVNNLIFVWIAISVILSKFLTDLFGRKGLREKVKRDSDRPVIGSASCLNYRNEPSECPFDYPDWCPYKSKRVFNEKEQRRPD